jgi:hypothetical protein
VALCKKFLVRRRLDWKRIRQTFKKTEKNIHDSAGKERCFVNGGRGILGRNVREVN